jgi:hypothetical protein
MDVHLAQHQGEAELAIELHPVDLAGPVDVIAFVSSAGEAGDQVRRPDADLA